MYSFYDSENVSPLRGWFKSNNLGEEVKQEEKPVQPSEHVYDTFEEDEEQQAVHNYNQGHTLRGSRPSIEEEEIEEPPF